MPDIQKDLEFEESIKAFPPDSQFLARQIQRVQCNCERHEERLKVLESRDNRTFGTIGGIAGLVGTAIGGALMYVIKNFKG